VQTSADLFADRQLAIGDVTYVTPPATIRIVVYGSPAPQGSKAFKGTFVGKDGRTHGIMAESSKKVRPWRNDVKEAALLVRNGAPPLDGPLAVRMIFTVPKPASAPKRRRLYPMRKPDVSKLARSTEDALTDAGIWTDDARITEYTRLAKVYPGEDPDALEACGAIIEITVIAL
jgi:crossover junction endodeoxyribonuclease RusA